MRHRLAALLSAVLVAGALVVLAPARPASAVEVCPFQGVARTGAPVFYPGLGPAFQNTFQFVWSLGACAHLPSGTTNKSLVAVGQFLGWCGLSSGQGTTANGNLFAWIEIGGTALFTGHVVGVVNMEPDILNGESCVSGADGFLFTGVIVLLNCTTLIGPDFDFLQPVPILGELHVWFNSPCIPLPL